MTKILALDLMSKLGWACRAPDGGIIFGTETFRSKGIESAGIRWIRFRIWLDEICTDIQPDIICFEQLVGFPTRNRGRDSSIYYGFLAHLQEFCDSTKREYQGIGVGTIKKFATGKGNAKKAAVVEAIRKLGYEVKDDNEADAIALLLCAEGA